MVTGIACDGRPGAADRDPQTRSRRDHAELNAYHDLLKFTLPATTGGLLWQLLIDTNLADEAYVD